MVIKVQGVEIPSAVVAKAERMLKQNSVRAYQIEDLLHRAGFHDPMRGADRILQRLKVKKMIRFNRSLRAWEWIVN